MSCRSKAVKAGQAGGAAGIPRLASQAGYETGLTGHVAHYLPRCQGCRRFLSPADPVCRNEDCPLSGKRQARPLPWPPPGVAFTGGRRDTFWRDYRARIQVALKAWRSQADDRALGSLRAALAVGLAEQAMAAGRNGHPAGMAGELAEERADLLLSPPQSLTVAERVERVAILDNALAWLRLRRAINEEQYHAALVGVLLDRQSGPARSTAPVAWLPDCPVGCEEEATSQVDPTKKVRVRYRVVDLDEPVTSNTSTGAINPDYDQRLQPRRRERAASRLQIDGIARKLDPEALLKQGASWSDGPPLVGPDGMVESGNGRLLALRRAAEINPEGYASYRRTLAEQAAQLGLDRAQVQQLQRPALVRERLTAMDDEARLRFITEANASGVARMGAAEQARADAALIPPGFFADLQVADSDFSLADVLTKKSNGPVVARFFKLLPETERAALMDAQGNLSAEGVSRLERAMFAYAMPGRSGERLARLVFEGSEAIDRVGAGVKRALPRLGQMEDLVRAGQRDGSFSIGDDLAAAVEKMRDLRKQGLSVNDYLRQYKMFGELTPLQEQLLVQLDGRRRSGRAVAELINAYADAVLRQPPPSQGRMFGGELATTREGLLRSALKSIGGTWVDLGTWSDAQRVTSGLNVPATQVQTLAPTRQALGMQLANRVSATETLS
jgi:hypothetical protein